MPLLRLSMKLPVVLKNNLHGIQKLGQGGFTLIEVLISLALVVLISGATLPLLFRAGSTTRFDEVSSELESVIRLARARSVARLFDQAYGVYFEISASGQDAYILYQGNSYATRNPSEDRRVLLDPSFELSTTLPGNEMKFARGVGTTVSGTVTLKGAQGDRMVLMVNTKGALEKQ